jgi:Replication-relaxation
MSTHHMYALPTNAIGRETMRRTSTRSRKPVLLSGVLDKILREAIYPYHFLTARQITRLLYPTEKQGMFTTIKARLKLLTDAKYLTAFHMPTKEGVRPYVYCLGMQGRKYLRAEGMDVFVYYEPEEVEIKTYGFLTHTLELNTFLIAAATIERSIADLRLYDFLHDFIIKSNPATAIDAKGKVAEIAPDGFLDLRTSKYRYCFLVEHDRGYQSDSKLRKKFADYLACFKQEKLGQHFGNTRKISVLFPTSAGVRRVEKMRELARQELKAFDAKNLSFFNNLFKFTTTPPLMAQPQDSKTLFCSPLWLTAYGKPTDTTALIDLSQ